MRTTKKNLNTKRNTKNTQFHPLSPFFLHHSSHPVTLTHWPTSLLPTTYLFPFATIHSSYTITFPYPYNPFSSPTRPTSPFPSSLNAPISRLPNGPFILHPFTHPLYLTANFSLAASHPHSMSKPYLCSSFHYSWFIWSFFKLFFFFFTKIRN